MIPRQPHYVVLLLSEKRLSIDKKCWLNFFIKSLCFYIQIINYRLALFCLDQASLLLKYEFRAEALDFPLVTRHKKESFL